jgi:hypothetical protein
VTESPTVPVVMLPPAVEAVTVMLSSAVAPEMFSKPL